MTGVISMDIDLLSPTYKASKSIRKYISWFCQYPKLLYWTKFYHIIGHFAFFQIILIWMITPEIVKQQQISIWDWTIPWVKKLKKTDPHLKRKMWVYFFSFLTQGMVWPQIAIHHCMTISRIFFLLFGPLKIKISKYNQRVRTLLGFLTI